MNNKVILVSHKQFKAILTEVKDTQEKEKGTNDEEKEIQSISTLAGTQIIPVEGVKDGTAVLCESKATMEIGEDITIKGLLKLV
ncbi:hypothetical protein LCGC14_0614060 [marine sediment metagenome]|uniref:Uncharacterized protein n=1 Tax=marine sediment metagenome TaxID=412755 RepID=A0A0F9TT87_9ZZZZ